MKVVHLTASPFYGGPERQMLGLAQAAAGWCQSVFVSFPERGLCRPFLNKAEELGFETIELKQNAPRYRAAVQELTGMLRQLQPDVLCCHGYKADMLGWFAARRTDTPVVGVSRGWTGCSLRVKMYDALDGFSLRWMDVVVCVSAGHAAKIRRAGVPAARVRVIRNAINSQRFASPDASYRDRLQGLFPSPRTLIIGASARLSPEKGFSYLINAAELICPKHPDAGIVIFGQGPLKEQLTAQIEAARLQDRVILAGFRNDLDRWTPMLDLFVLPSFSEGLPNVVLEAFAAGVPVVATAVDGTPEVVDEGVSGYLVPPGDAAALAGRIGELLADDGLRRRMGQRGRERVQREFTFAAQAEQYQQLFEELQERRTGKPRRKSPSRHAFSPA
jgi:glycosyltransferase involved in cell wall biosynthesis